MPRAPRIDGVSFDTSDSIRVARLTDGVVATGNRRVFVSYSHSDRGFVRRLVRNLHIWGCDSWLDEKSLFVGDAIPEAVAKGIADSDVVVIVVSRASVGSRWVKHELSLAATRMVAGKCLLMPVLIDDVVPPAEIESLLYADCRPGRRGGMAKLRTALGRYYEGRAKSATENTPTTVSTPLKKRRPPSRGDQPEGSLLGPTTFDKERAVDRILGDVFDRVDRYSQSSRGSYSIAVSELDYSDEYTDGIPYAYSGKARDYFTGELAPLDFGDIEDFLMLVRRELGARLSLVISYMEPSERMKRGLTRLAPGVYSADEYDRGWKDGKPAPQRRVTRCIIVDIHDVTDDETLRKRLTRARSALRAAEDLRGYDPDRHWEMEWSPAPGEKRRWGKLRQDFTHITDGVIDLRPKGQ